MIQTLETFRSAVGSGPARPLRRLVFAGITLIAADVRGAWLAPSLSPTTAHAEQQFPLQIKTVLGRLLIHFEPARRCQPDIGLVIVFEGDRVDGPKAEQWADSKMTVWVDGKRVWSERTAITGYTNGFKTTAAATPQLIEALARGYAVEVQPFADVQKFNFSLKGSAKAIGMARRNCR